MADESTVVVHTMKWNANTKVLAIEISEGYLPINSGISSTF
jgi:hypothetical protein